MLLLGGVCRGFLAEFPWSFRAKDMLKLEKAFNNELHERLDEASAARADAPEEKIANSCWAADKTEKGYAED